MMASRILFNSGIQIPYKQIMIRSQDIRESWNDFTEAPMLEQWSSVIIAKGNIIEGIEAKE